MNEPVMKRAGAKLKARTLGERIDELEARLRTVESVLAVPATVSGSQLVTSERFSSDSLEDVSDEA